MDHVTRTAAEIGRGLQPARDGRPIPEGQRIHVVGVAGAGASAAALLAHHAGALVSGCDPGGPSPYTAALAAAGIPLEWEHSASHVAGPGGTRVDRLGVTKALTSIAPDHPELEAARASGVPLEAWQQIIADAAVSHGGRLVAIAGTHGKSTSSGWLLHVLAEAGRDPAGFVGALLPAALTGGIPATARWGGGDEFVVEADEYAGNFDPYRADLAIVLNAEWDHPDVFADEAAVLDAFEGWLTVPGADRRTVVINVGDAGAARLAERVEGRVSRVLRVRLDAEGDSSGAGDIVGRRSPDDSLLITGLESAPHAAIEAHLGLRGRHNAANALCVAAAASVLGVPGEAIARGLSTFRGVGRRLELKGEPLGVAIYDDYGHHPTAIAASIAALRERHPGRRLLAVYEPLTFHRTAAMLEQFADVMAGADEAFVADIWAGRDPDTTIASPVALADAINRHGRAHAAPTGSVEATADSLIATVREGDVVLVMGGGRSYVIAERLLEGLSTLAAGRGPVD